MNALEPDNILQNTLSPQRGISVSYIKIPFIIDLIFCSPPDPNYKRLPCRQLEQASFRVPFLSAGEFTILNGFKAQKKQIEWVCGRFALKTLVNKKLSLDMPLEEIKISYQKRGAPFLNDYPDISISLSHSGDYTAAALSQTPGTTIGIDIEQIGKMPDSFFMKTAFSAKEIRSIAPKAHEIFRHWTIKEAFLKYIKMGFNENLHRVEILDNKIFHHGKRQRLTTWSETIDNKYILSMVAGDL